MAAGNGLAYAGPVGLTVSNALLDGETVGLRCADGAITAVGPEVEPELGDELIDATGLALVPGLVNAHTHAAMTLFRGFADDLALMEWLERHIWPIEKRMDDEDVYWGTRLACLEMIRTGTTCFWDMYWHAHATARAVEDAGLRAVTAAPLIDDADPAKSERACSDAERSLEQIAGAGGRLARPGFAPHAIYSVSERSLRWVAERARELEVTIQIHLSETEDEVRGCLETHGERPAMYLDRAGVLGPTTVLAHGCWLDRDELELIANRGATVVTNPVANLKLAVGRVFPYGEARPGWNRVLGSGPTARAPTTRSTCSPMRRYSRCCRRTRRAIRPRSLPRRRSRSPPGSGRACSAVRVSGKARLADFLLVRAQDPELALGDLAAGSGLLRRRARSSTRPWSTVGC